MNKELVLKYICMPMAMSVLKHDRKLQEENLKIPTPYLNLNDSIMEQLEKDFYELKRYIISKHHMDIRKQEGNKYIVNGEIVEFTSEELREGTKQIIQSYMYGDNAVEINFEDRPWRDTDYKPPDIDNKE